MIELGGLQMDGYEWPKVLDKTTGEFFIICRDEDICGIVE